MVGGGAFSLLSGTVLFYLLIVKINRFPSEECVKSEVVSIARVRRINEIFCPQARRFSAAILTDCKGKQRRMRSKKPFRRCAMVMETASKS
jgi:hypothetical protein